MTVFQQKVYQITKKIPRGRVSTYKLVAKAAGRPRAYRAVGNILHVNSYSYNGAAQLNSANHSKFTKNKATSAEARRKQAKADRRGIPSAKLIPCHRVVKSDGSLGGFGSGLKNKVALLETEGVKVKNGNIIDFKKVLLKL